jgi:hypothetical protein
MLLPRRLLQVREGLTSTLSEMGCLPGSKATGRVATLNCFLIAVDDSSTVLHLSLGLQPFAYLVQPQSVGISVDICSSRVIKHSLKLGNVFTQVGLL